MCLWPPKPVLASYTSFIRQTNAAMGFSIYILHQSVYRHNFVHSNDVIIEKEWSHILLPDILADFTKRPSFFGKPLRKTGHLQYLCGRTYSIITLYLIYVEIKHKKCLDSNIPFQALDFRKASM